VSLDPLPLVNSGVLGLPYGPCEHCLNQPPPRQWTDVRRLAPFLPRDGTIADVRGEGMGDIAFRGREPFDLIAQRLPSAIAENKIVVATVPILHPAFPAIPLKFGSC
jgi:hypothetical protein